MPEGDTLRKVAAALRPYLVGRTIREAVLRGPGVPPGGAERLVGHRVGRVEAVGKHLLVTAGESLLRVHLGMDGSWHRYRPGEPWQRSERSAGVVLATDDSVLVCFRPQDVECVAARDRGRLRALRGLGPDLLDDAVDLDEVLRRARTPANAERAVAEVLLDQTVAAGIGNVYKSEVLFLAGVDPWAPTGALDDETLRGLYDRARRLLVANVRQGWRTTTRVPGEPAPPGRSRPRLWVYRRVNRACLRCGARIRSAAQGTPTPRTTYWCPRCQRG